MKQSQTALSAINPMIREFRIKTARSKGHYPVVIIGAGINGIGVFNDLCRQGVDCLLIDRSDFCSGTSAAPSRMIHGGLKYMETGEFRLVRESVEERNRLLQNAPHLVRPMETIIPIKSMFGGEFQAMLLFLGFAAKSQPRGRLIVQAGLSFYDFFSRKNRMTPTHRILSGWDIRSEFCGMSEEIHYGASFYDAQITMPERLGVELVIDGMRENKNSIALNHCEFVKAQGGGLLLHDSIGSEDFEVSADVVINAAGPWIDSVNASVGEKTKVIAGAKGSHIVLDLPALHDQLAGRMIYFDPGDSRICLITSISGKVLLGSTDKFVESADDVFCEDDEIDYMLGAMRSVFPDINATRDHIVYTYSGVRPLPYSNTGDTATTSRDHSVFITEETDECKFPVLSLIGGKWTTYRAFGEEVSDLVLKRLGCSRKISTKDIPIGGGRGLSRKAADWQCLTDEITTQLGADRIRAKYLVSRYGSRAREVVQELPNVTRAVHGLPDVLESEIVYMVENEMCETIEDVVLRRLPLGLSGKLTEETVEDISTIIGQVKRWSEQHRVDQIEALSKKLLVQHRISLTTGKFSAEQGN